MKSTPYRVHYPNGSHVVHALGPQHAAQIAMERWGTPPAHVEETEED